MRRAALPCGLALLAALAGCRHWHRDTSAPGVIDVAAPPPPGQHRVAPQDPGENMLAINPGVHSGGGARAESPHGFGEVGVELTVNRGENDRSHHEDSFFVYPERGVGASLGWSFLRYSGDGAGGTDLDGGPLYAEVQAFRLPWIAGGGYAIDPFTGDHGPQIFGAMANLYVRARYLFDAGAEITFGMQLKLPFVQVWSR